MLNFVSRGCWRDAGAGPDFSLPGSSVLLLPGSCRAFSPTVGSSSMQPPWCWDPGAWPALAAALVSLKWLFGRMLLVRPLSMDLSISSGGFVSSSEVGHLLWPASLLPPRGDFQQVLPVWHLSEQLLCAMSHAGTFSNEVWISARAGAGAASQVLLETDCLVQIPSMTG